MRRVFISAPSPYIDNTVTTSKYNLFSFLPLALFGQFRRFANLYFLLIGLLMFFGESTHFFLSPYLSSTTLVPLVKHDRLDFFFNPFPTAGNCDISFTRFRSFDRHGESYLRSVMISTTRCRHVIVLTMRSIIDRPKYYRRNILVSNKSPRFVKLAHDVAITHTTNTHTHTHTGFESYSSNQTA